MHAPVRELACCTRLNADARVGHTCTHCLFHEHEHLFAMNSYAVRFTVTPVKLYDINFAPTQCHKRAQKVLGKYAMIYFG